MSYHGQLVIDADCHIREYWDLDRTYKEHIDPAYREKYEQLSRAVRAHQQQPGDVGLGDVLWPSLPGHPMGVYDGFTAQAQGRGSGSAERRPNRPSRGAVLRSITPATGTPPSGYGTWTPPASTSA